MDALEDLQPDIVKPPWGPVGRDLTLGVVSLACKFVLKLMNTFSMFNAPAFFEAVYERPKGIGLITVSNHTSTLDDPALFSAMLPWTFFLTEHIHQQTRWAVCAKEVCFRNEFLRQFFLNGKVLPVARGGGVDQPVMQVLAGEVARGHWVHVFPEGRVHYTGHLGPFKWGVGKLVCNAQKMAGRDPVVLPFYHQGMGDVLPFRTTFPRMGQQVTVSVGRELDLSDLTCNCNKEGVDQQKVWEDITWRIHTAMKDLEAHSPPNTDQTKNPNFQYPIVSGHSNIKLVKYEQLGARGIWRYPM